MRSDFRKSFGSYILASIIIFFVVSSIQQLFEIMLPATLIGILSAVTTNVSFLRKYSLRSESIKTSFLYANLIEIFGF